MSKVSTTLSNHIKTNLPTDIFISVERITGTTLEKKIIAETLITPTINLVAKSAVCAIAAGNSISTIEMVEACANIATSWTGNILING